MTEQLALRVFAAAPEDANVLELERILADYQGWMSSSLIGSHTGWNSDKVNALARVSSEIISGQRGYKHLRHATSDEQTHFFNGLISRARELANRAARVRRRAHQLVGV